jgi:hypothetical protein
MRVKFGTAAIELEIHQISVIFALLNAKSGVTVAWCIRRKTIGIFSRERALSESDLDVRNYCGAKYSNFELSRLPVNRRQS